MVKTNQIIWFETVFLVTMVLKMCLMNRTKAKISIIIFSRVYKKIIANNKLETNLFIIVIYSSLPQLLMPIRIANKS